MNGEQEMHWRESVSTAEHVRDHHDCARCGHRFHYGTRLHRLHCCYDNKPGCGRIHLESNLEAGCAYTNHAAGGQRATGCTWYTIVPWASYDGRTGNTTGANLAEEVVVAAAKWDYTYGVARCGPARANRTCWWCRT